MAFIDSQLLQIRKQMDSFMDERHSENLQCDRVDYAYEIKGSSVIYLQRYLRIGSKELMTRPVAKVSHDSQSGDWNVYYRTRDNRWQPYKQAPIVSHLGEFFEVLEYDEVDIFYG